MIQPSPPIPPSMPEASSIKACPITSGPAPACSASQLPAKVPAIVIMKGMMIP